MQLRLGIDIACRAPHQASLADESGRFVFAGYRFRTHVSELEELWSMLPEGTEAADVMVVMEPTRNAWVALAAWFRRRGARVVLVPPEQSADLRAYFSKHTKTDRVDSRLLARIPLLHPEGLHEEHGLGPGDPLRRATRIRQSLVKRRSKNLSRLDALLEILGPGWLVALGSDLANKTPLRFLAAGYACPHTVRRLGRARLARFIYRHSRGAWGEDKANELLDAAEQTLALWAEELDFGELAEDIAVEARLALSLTEEIAALDERIAVQFHAADPQGILVSVPGVGAITGAQILGRLGDPARFRSLAGVRSFSGLVPSLEASGLMGQHGGPTKRGDACLREAVFMAADHARRIDPTLAARYHRLMVSCGKHHNSALCHVASTLLTRIVACWRRGRPYVLRDVDGRAVSLGEARRIVAERYTVPSELRRARLTTPAGRQRRTGRRSQESQSAPSAGPSRRHATVAAGA
ncbi:MAG: IS110 family transposase [Actinomycetota bacterium]